MPTITGHNQRPRVKKQVLLKILPCRVAGVGFRFRVDARLRKWLFFTAGPTEPAMGVVGRLLLFMGVLLRELQHSGGMRVAIKSI